MMKNWFWPKRLRTEQYEKYIFQQDSERPHTTRAVQTQMKEIFCRKFIAKEKWPPRSPDLNPCDFFLQGYLKQRMYFPIPNTIEDLKANIERELKAIPKDMLKKTFLNFKRKT